MQGDFIGSLYTDYPGHAQYLQYEEMQTQLWMGKAAMAQANLALAHENMLLHAMQQNALLAYENNMLREDNMLRMQALAPPGLEQQVLTGWPYMSPAAPVSTSRASLKPSPRQGKASAIAGRLNSRRESEVSTTAGSSPSCSLDNSIAASDNDHDGLGRESQAPGTSAMMRNLPNDYTRSMLLELLHAEGFGGLFDFVYIPVDFRSGSGLGYSFINFISLDSAEQFRQHFSGFNRWAVASDKVCDVTWSSLQGLEAHVERYRSSPVMHESVPEEQKPALFKGCEAVPFPAPTKKIRIPRHWHRRR